MLPSVKQKMDLKTKFEAPPEMRKKRERNFVQLQLNTDTTKILNLDTEGTTQPVLVIQSPKTPTLSRKLKAVSLDSDAGLTKNLEVARDVSSVPNTPKKQARTKEKVQLGYMTEFDSLNDFNQKATLTPLLGSNLKRFASNQSISGSQTLKTLPEVMTLQDFSGVKTEPIRIKAKGLLERRGSNASLTIDLGSNTSLAEPKQAPIIRLNTAKSVSNLNLTSFGCEKCLCQKKDSENKNVENVVKKTQNNNEKCSHTIYESVPSVSNNLKKHHRHTESMCKCNFKFLPKYYIERHCVCYLKFRRKSLSNENLYVPPCNFCHFGSKDCYMNRGCIRGSRRALYPRQTYIETSQLLSEDFKLHLQNIQYLQTAGSVLSIADLKSCCQMEKIPRLHQEFWEIPLNLQEKCLVSGSQSRNRYRGVLPNEHSRVHLPGIQPYIHANYIKGPDYTETAYIATQGPMSHTCEDFWNMIWSNQVKQIVMLTGLVEKGRSKCELYFPLGEENKLKTEVRKKSRQKISPFASNQHLTDSSEDECMLDIVETDVICFGAYTITYISKEILGECVIRTLEVNKSVVEDALISEQGRKIKKFHGKNITKSETRTLYHYWYPNWADHKLANPEQVLKIALRVMGLEKDSKNSSTTESTSSDLLESDSSGVNDANSDVRLDGELSNTHKSDLRLSSEMSKTINSDLRLSDRSSSDLRLGNDLSNDDNITSANVAVSGTNMDTSMPVGDVSTKLTSSCAKMSRCNVTFDSSRDNNTIEALNLPDDKVFSFDIDGEKAGSKFSFETEPPIKKEDVNNPITAHCSAGIGRTGCFLAVLNGIQQLRTNYNVDILAIVCSLRLNRGGMVQTAEQYELIHRVLSLYADIFHF